MARPAWVTVPNIISVLRLAMVPVFLVYHLTGHPARALTWFIVAAVSDVLDGLAARLLNQRSALGAWLDPIADKVLVFAALVSLSLEHRLPVWVLGLVIFRDGFFIIGALVVRAKRLDVEVKPTRVGKYATFCLVVLIVLALADQIVRSSLLLHQYTQVVGLLAGLAIIVSTIQYFVGSGYVFFAPARPLS